MIIAIEGLACVGKSTLIQRLSSELSATCVPEVVPEVVNHCCDHGHGFAGPYYANDLAKSCQAATAAQFNKIVLVDRYYVSTIAHYLARCCVSPPQMILRAAELFDDFYMGVQAPDLWLYLVEEPKAAWSRYTAIRPQDMSSQWTTLEGTTRIRDAMDICFASRVIGSVPHVTLQSAPVLSLECIMQFFPSGLSIRSAPPPR